MIVLNKMFVEDYCLENIGHEIINMFMADNGHYYVYLNSTGDFARDKQGRIDYPNVWIISSQSIINMVKVKNARFGEHIISQNTEGSILVYRDYDNIKGTLREIAESIRFEYENAWTTRQFGSKLIDELNKE